VLPLSDSLEIAALVSAAGGGAIERSRSSDAVAASMGWFSSSILRRYAKWTST
jgi:hypothetical protein